MLTRNSKAKVQLMLFQCLGLTFKTFSPCRSYTRFSDMSFYIFLFLYCYKWFFRYKLFVPFLALKPSSTASKRVQPSPTESHMVTPRSSSLYPTPSFHQQEWRGNSPTWNKITPQQGSIRKRQQSIGALRIRPPRTSCLCQHESNGRFWAMHVSIFPSLHHVFYQHPYSSSLFFLDSWMNPRSPD